MRVAIGCDHGGLNIKNAIIEYLKENNIEYTDFGCYTEESVDYPVFIPKVNDILMPLVAFVPLQLIAYYTAVFGSLYSI